MAQQKGKRNPDKPDKNGFFTAQNQPPRAQSAPDQDGDDTLPLQGSPGETALP
ncbi:Hypothetical predicted protein, partial [Pelobates cultripes]